MLQSQRLGAVADVNLATAAPTTPGDTSGMEALQAHIETWAQSPDIYAVVLRAGDWPRTPGYRAAPTLAAPGLPTQALASAELKAVARLIWRLDCFPKPLVALIDGPLSGAPLALASVATHRVGGSAARYSITPFAAGEGLPLAGLASTLARLPGATGLYLAMTGHEIGPRDALALGLLTHHIPSEASAGIAAALADSQPVDPLLDNLEDRVGAPPLAPHRATLDHCFGAATPAAIMARLAAVTGADAAWAATTRTALAQQSLIDLAIVQRLLTEARHLNLREALHLCYNLAIRLAADRSETISLDALFSAAPVDDFSLPQRADFAFGRF